MSASRGATSGPHSGSSSVVALIVDPFPWNEVEAFAIALSGSGYRLLPTSAPRAEGRDGWAASYDFEAMRQKAQKSI